MIDHIRLLSGACEKVMSYYDRSMQLRHCLMAQRKEDLLGKCRMRYAKISSLG